MPSLRRCLGCPALIGIDAHRGRCPTCNQAAEQARGTRAQRGYDTPYDQERRRWQARLDRGEPIDCWRCSKPIDPARWHLGHDDRDRSIIHGPEHVPCNLGNPGGTP